MRKESAVTSSLAHFRAKSIYLHPSSRLFRAVLVVFLVKFISLVRSRVDYDNF